MTAITFSAYGDSLTASPASSWIATASDGTQCEHVGGFARGGYRSYQVAAGVTPCTADVTVVMVGTNDVSSPRWRVPLLDTLHAIRDIIVNSGASRALVVAMPPRNDGYHAEADQLNTDIRNYAIGMGWMWVDPWTTMRTSDGKFRAGWSTDGIHPNTLGASRAGHWLRYMIQAAK